ncbi:MAG: NAD(P)/FAD-dependent oxidoreductase [Candidatus Heimdallarchaeota archaeon]|nr:NAD(P)/FAD-dependent oxidoreductase [Candidatus Heimdallarchaeota archaeon]MCK4770834.1 NAD(P)/FAD-dependent oxidoreductase [Candidatus Heimdallarchaeota archaeon]
MSKKIVILGGGTGGLIVANKLRKLAKVNDVLLVDKEKNHLFNPSLLWVMTGWRTKNQIQKPLSRLQRKGIKFVNTLVENIDFKNQIIVTPDGDMPYDYLVIALGASTFPERMEGFSESAYNVFDLVGVEEIRDAVEDFDKGRIVVLVSSMPFKCPAAPYEAALLLSAHFTKKKRKNVEIEMVTPETIPMAVAGEEIGNMVVSLLQSRGISFKPQHQTTHIDPTKKKITFSDEKTLSYDLLIGVPPHGPPEFLKDSPIVEEKGWVKVNPRTMETDLENVYALGDVTSIILPDGKPLPKAGVFAHYQADVVAHNILAKMKNKSDKKEFTGKGSCFIELGDGRAGYASGNFYTEPTPKVNLKKPSRWWHWQKVLFEKVWFWKWF